MRNETIHAVNHDIKAIEAHIKNHPGEFIIMWASLECEQHYLPRRNKNVKEQKEPYSQKNTLPVLYKGGENK